MCGAADKNIKLQGADKAVHRLSCVLREDGEDTDETIGTSCNSKRKTSFYNIRFAEMITDAAVYAAEEDESENTYIVSRDFAWGYEKKMTRVMRHCKSPGSNFVRVVYQMDFQ